MIRVQNETLPIYHHLAQAYEAEFSRLTGKVPDTRGLFPLDTIIGGSVIGYIDMLNDTPIGIAALEIHSDFNDLREFYIIPSRRKQDHGKKFAHRIFALHPGAWQIKQIAGADYAVAFWRKTIAAYGVTYREENYHDHYWGPVTRQLFTIAGFKSGRAM
jgi:predicted acetyltransferase